MSEDWQEEIKRRTGALVTENGNVVIEEWLVRELFNERSKYAALVEAVEDILGCPFWICDRTVPEGGDLDAPHVVGLMSIARERYMKLRRAFSDLEENEATEGA